MNPLLGIAISTLALGAEPYPTTRLDLEAKAAFQHMPAYKQVTPDQGNGSTSTGALPAYAAAFAMRGRG